jgi:mono/diheme cytochrome c family protein
MSTAVGFGFAGWQPASSGPVITETQVDAGRASYGKYCASCHMADLGGRDDAPSLAGDGFISSWKAKTTTELFEFVRDTMPPEGPTLPPAEYLNIVAHILHENGAAFGPAALTAATAAPIGAVASGKRPQLARMQPDRINVTNHHPRFAICLSPGAPRC